jgi:hypothetical protein
MNQIGARTRFAGLEGRAFASLLNGSGERQEKNGKKVNPELLWNARAGPSIERRFESSADDRGLCRRGEKEIMEVDKKR